MSLQPLNTHQRLAGCSPPLNHLSSVTSNVPYRTRRFLIVPRLQVLLAATKVVATTTATIVVAILICILLAIVDGIGNEHTTQ